MRAEDVGVVGLLVPIFGLQFCIQGRCCRSQEVPILAVGQFLLGIMHRKEALGGTDSFKLRDKMDCLAELLFVQGRYMKLLIRQHFELTDVILPQDEEAMVCTVPGAVQTSGGEPLAKAVNLKLGMV